MQDKSAFGELGTFKALACSEWDARGTENGLAICITCLSQLVFELLSQNQNYTCVGQRTLNRTYLHVVSLAFAAINLL